jgi:hypothetical protein
VSKAHSKHGEIRNAYKFLVKKPGVLQLILDTQYFLDWIHLAQGKDKRQA